MRSATQLQFNSKFEADEMYMYDNKTTMVLTPAQHTGSQPKSQAIQACPLSKIRVTQSNQRVLSNAMSIEWLGLGTLAVTQCVKIKIKDLIPVTERVSIRLITRRGI